MIRHIVVMKFAAGCTPEQHAHLLGMLRELRQQVPVVRAISVGTHMFTGSPAPDVGLVVDVDTVADLDAYTQHPYHLEVGRYFSEIKESASAVDITVPAR